MRFEEYKFLVYSDLYRLIGRSDLRALIQFLLRGESFKYVFWMRTCHYASKNRRLRYTVLPIARFFLRHLKYKFGISIPYTTQIGPGFYIGHFGGIVVNSHSVIGKNCNISHCVTLGQANRGEKKGYPQIGDNVYIGPGAKIVGNVKVGDNVAIGANCVVTKDVPDNAVVVGIPGRVISHNGSAGYVRFTDYEDIID
jgi:serine O-acetyltransferase